MPSPIRGVYPLDDELNLSENKQRQASTSCRASDKDLSVVELDPHGDLTVRAGASTLGVLPARTFHVCSRALSRASPVFERMLYGTFSESNPENTPWTVDLPEDDPDMLGLFFDIAHGRLDRIPATRTIDQLYDLTVLTHYYDATRLLAPWTDKWISSITKPHIDAGLELPKLLWIGWELRRQALYENAAKRMLMECSPSLCASQSLRALQMPGSIIDHIYTLQTTTLRALLRPFHDILALLTVVDEQPRWCQHATFLGPHRCESMILGSIVFCLTRAGLWPLPTSDADIHHSVLGLYDVLVNLVIHDIGKVAARGIEDHSACNPRGFLIGRLRDILAGMKGPVGEGERAHFRVAERRA